MSKVLKIVGTIASVVALVTPGLQAFGVAGLKAVATVSALVAGVASIGAQLTAPKPVARGSVTQIVIAAEPPRPYLMGETYFAGVLRHQVGYGATLNKVPNPYLWEVVVYSGVSVDALVAPQFDFGAISSYYSSFYATDTQLGATPESTALVPPYGTAPGWNSTSKLSGNAAIGWNFKFDKDGKRYASGRPVTGAIWRGVKVYDPRLDSTFPGGSGSCRLGNESTYVYSRSPALHAGTYCYGRYQNGKKVFGIGMNAEGIDFEAIAAWANDCEANEWYCDGVIFEGGEQSGSGIKARNLSDICAAGGGQWITAGAVISFDWNRPRTSLATITDADIMREGGMDAIAVQPLRDRYNTVRPQYRSPDHNWELITADPIVGSTYVTEDGESKTQTWPLNLVKGETQAGQLATYALTDAREIGPITLNLPAEWRFYRPGDTLTLNSARLSYNGPVVIQRRTFSPETLVTTLVVRSETPAKHAFALGEVAVPPPTPTLGQTGEDRDTVRDEITQFYLVGGRQPEDIATTVASGGGVAPNQVDTDAVIDNAISGFSQSAGSSTTFNDTAFTTVGSVTLTPESTATKWLVSASGIVTIGDASPGGTLATIRCIGAFPDFLMGQRAVPSSFSLSTVISGLSGPATLDLQIQATDDDGGGDPHLVEVPRLIALKLAK